MTIYTSEMIDGSCVIFDPKGNFVGYMPSQIAASSLLKRLNGPKALHALHERNKVCEIHCEGRLFSPLAECP